MGDVSPVDADSDRSCSLGDGLYKLIRGLVVMKKFLDRVAAAFIWFSVLAFIGAMSYGIYTEIGREGTFVLVGIVVYAFAISWAIHRAYE